MYRLPMEHRPRMKSTNMLERYNEEIHRRTRVVRIFPNAESCLRLILVLAAETHERWLTGQRYLYGRVSAPTRNCRRFLTQLSHAGEHAADAPIARPWVLVLTRPERSPTVGRSRPRWLRWHADERKGIPVFEDVVSPVDIRKHIRFFGGSSKKHLRFGMGYGNLRLVRWSLVPT